MLACKHTIARVLDPSHCSLVLFLEMASYHVTPAQLLEPDLILTVYIGLSQQELASIRTESPEKVRGNIVREVAEKRHRRYRGDYDNPLVLTIQLTAVGLLTMFCAGQLRFSEDVARWSFRTSFFSELCDASGALMYRCFGADLPSAYHQHPLSVPALDIFFCLSESQARVLLRRWFAAVSPLAGFDPEDDIIRGYQEL